MNSSGIVFGIGVRTFWWSWVPPLGSGCPCDSFRALLWSFGVLGCPRGPFGGLLWSCFGTFVVLWGALWSFWVALWCVPGEPCGPFGEPGGPDRALARYLLQIMKSTFLVYQLCFGCLGCFRGALWALSTATSGALGCPWSFCSPFWDRVVEFRSYRGRTVAISGSTQAHLMRSGGEYEL